MSGPDVTVSDLTGQVLAPAGANLVLAQWTARANTGREPLYQAPPHRHEEDEAWYVLSGTLRLQVGEEEIEIPAGGAAIVPGGTVHTYWNPAAEPARYLLVMGARTYALIQALHAAGDLTPEQMRQLYRRYGAEMAQ